MRSGSILRKLLFLLCVGSLALVSVASAADDNLAPTPDFESNPSGHWLRHGPCSFSWASDEAHSGSRSLKIGSSTSSLCRWLSNVPAIPVNPGQSYDVTAWMQTAGSRAAGVLAVSFWNEAREYVSRTVYGATALTGAREWTQLFLAATAPPDAAFLRVENRLNGPGTLWADDVQVSVGAPYPKSGPVVKGALLEAGQTIKTTRGRWTGSPIQFQVQWVACVRPEADCVDIPGATAETYTLTDAEVGMFIQSRVRATSFGRTAEASSSPRGPVLQARPASGNLARNIDVELEPSAYYYTHGPCQFDWTTSAAHSPTHALRTVSDTSALCRWYTKPTLIPVRPGQRYTVSAWFRTTDVAGYAQLAVNFWTRAPRNYIPPTVHSQRTVSGTQDWTRLEVRATAPPEAAYVRVEFRLVGPGTLWTDDLSVTNATPDGGTTSTSTSTSSTSTTSTSTSSTTATTAPGGTCCNGDGFFGFVSTHASGDCGDVISTTGTVTNVACSGLYLGGGGNIAPLPMTPPDETRSIFSIVGCDGPRGILGAATAAQTTSDRTCTSAGCLFGAPLPLPNSFATPTSVCAVQVFTAPPTGTADCTTGASNLELPLAWIYHLTGDTAVDPGHTMSGIQPCPLCSSGTCIGGPNNGMACTPGTTGINDAYPTSHDCPPDPLFDVGTLPIGLNLSSGIVTWSGTLATNDTGATIGLQSRTFSGYCRDADESGNFEQPARLCWENGMAVGPPCSGIFETCQQRNNGAFGPAGGANRTIAVSGNAMSLLGGPAATTLVGIFSVPPSFDATVDAWSDLPGPGTITMPGTASTCSSPTSCAATCLPSCPSTTSTSATSTTSTSSTTTSSTTATSTSSTTTSTTPVGTCCNGDAFLGFVGANIPGDCGDLIVAFGLGTTVTDLACSGLYIGGGGNAFPLPLTPPDQTRAVFSIVGCDGPRGVLGATTAAETSTDRTCTGAGCFFGAPLPIPYAFDPQLNASVCAVQVFTAPPTGVVDCATGASNLNLPLGWIYHLTSDTAVDPAGTIPGVQPCPLCSSGTCIGGPNNGMACTPGTTALGDLYPTSQDCPPDPMLAVGTLPIALPLSNGTVTWTGTVATNDTGATFSVQNRAFSGFCRDVSGSGEFEDPARQCWENGMAVGPACSGVFESCEQRNNGAFGPAGGANRTIRVIGNAMSLIGGPAAETLVGLFSIPPSYSVFDATGDLPGPAALTMPGTAFTCSTAASCP